MAQRVEVTATKHNDGVIPGTHVVKRENQVHVLSSGLHSCVMSPVSSHKSRNAILRI